MGSETMTVIGGGLVGAAIAYGAAKSGLHVRVLDQGDVAFRASRGNFGLVWVQSKGEHLAEYARWSRDASKLWPELQSELLDFTGVDCGLQQPGGFSLCFSEAEFKQHSDVLEAINRKAGDIPFQMMERSELQAYLPGLGPTVFGASYCPLDGHVNPLMLLRGFHAGLHKLGADIINGVTVAHIRHDATNGCFEVLAEDGQRWTTDRIVLAAGLDNARLAPQVGLLAPVEAIRGQILVTERLKPFLDYPLIGIRQTKEGSIQIGSSSEDVGLDDGTTSDRIAWMARRAVATFPALSTARMIRAWGSLRVLTPDGYPIYQGSTSCPGAYVATTHSGVTLAAAHSSVIAPWMCGLAQAPADLAIFKGDRFSDPNARYTRED